MTSNSSIAPDCGRHSSCLGLRLFVLFDVGSLQMLSSAIVLPLAAVSLAEREVSGVVAM